MKKKLIAFFLTGILLVSLTLVSFATSNFNLSVFNNSEDVTVEYDDMTGSTNVYATSLINGEGDVKIDYNYDYVAIYPHVGVTKDMDAYIWCIDYFARNWAFIDEITFKIGNNLYTFTDFTTTRRVYSDTTVKEHLAFSITNESIPFMQDLIEHRDEKIKVRLHGSMDSFDFFMPDNVKDGLINLYNLYVMGGGLNADNMELITILDDSHMTIKHN